ncbi:MAG TPA: hypothetical protein VG148_00490 [Pyrinomonadaceae bacterium]|nr:hypothetical protein [Pyrinomonadaceae bacterium]
MVVLTMAVAVCAVSVLYTRASNPASGTITPTSAPLSWEGTAVGGTASGEGTCVEGVNCDTFTLTVAGTPAEWAGKRIRVTFTWVVLANDYDLYIHKTNNAGALVDSSTGGAPSTSETAEINPAIDGTGVFTVHAVYFTGTAADQYHAVATVIDSGPSATPTPTPPPRSDAWKIVYHGTCCEGNLAASGADTYVLLPELLTGNDIWRSSDGGKTWAKKYPLADVSEPFGIEGDLNAFGDDIVFFGTELANGVVAHSDNRGDSWTVVQFPVPFVANDQAWGYLGPLSNVAPLGVLQTEPYVLAGWYRIGSVVAFSFDGGLTWPVQTPLVGVNGSGPEHVVCQTTARDPDPAAPADTRLANANFARMKAGRHGGWGADRKFYWTETAGGSLYVCKTGDFGVNWSGVKHPVAEGPGSANVVTHAAFDQKGTLYVLHGDKLYVSFNQGETIAYVHTLPRWGNAGRSDSGADQFFVVDNGRIHVGLLEDAGGGTGNVFYLRGTAVDTAAPVWQEELVDVVGNVRLDFMQIVLNGNGIPTISYTTPGEEVTTASRLAPMPAARLNHALSAYGATAVASSVYPSWDFSPMSAIDGDRTGASWGSGGGWNDGTRGLYPDWLEVRFGGARTVNEVRVYTLQDGYGAGQEPTAQTSANESGIIDFDVQTWNGSAWATVGSVRGNSLALRTVTFPAVSTTKVRVLVLNSRLNYSRVVEVEAFGPASQ